MSRIPFDKYTPRPIARLLTKHTVIEVEELGWGQLINVKLLDAAENSGFDVLLTGDKRMRNEQKMRGRRLAVVAMSSSFAGFLASPPKVRTGPGC